MINVWDVAYLLAAVTVGHVAGGLINRAMGKRWKTSIRGMLVATALIALSLCLLVSQLRK